MSSYPSFEEGGMCYVACEETFEYYNNSRFYCYRGCDFGKGRVNVPKLRKEAESMCKRMTAEALETQVDLDKIKDLRVSPFMDPDSSENIYKACLSGIRRQRW
ncbi:unnamed protein product [Blepharisma stoltei]|uniref:Uncharacterized protein n=1 Tax=Blepharisma stoltei TaxID=1481888 RepID=A0AAU9IEQ2_9CILI|nr:unnamed protein product [Blepharisma stoltei]